MANAHVPSGRRTGETDRPKRRHRAPVRPRWATDALDEVRRAEGCPAWNEARGTVTQRTAPCAKGMARGLKHARYALWKNPEDLTDKQREKLAWVAKTDPRLRRANHPHRHCRLLGAGILTEYPPRTGTRPASSASNHPRAG